MNDVLLRFSAPVGEWFRTTLGEPTPPQVAGWPAIQRGDHTLILAPTGSGKTMAAFLWGIDELLRVEGGAWRAGSGEREDDGGKRGTGKRKHAQGGSSQGLRIVYISPLKALNNDIERNLRVPLAGIRKQAQEMGVDLPEISVAVRSGDTPQRERQAMLKRPPHILITTPESLYMMLTSQRARQLFQSVRTVIVDEIHTLAGDKRGVHLALSLERLQHLAEQPIQRIGLSATIRPLDEVARYLGGNAWDGEANGERILQPRPVTIVDAGYKKPLDLLVETVVDDFRNLPGGSVWPAIIPRVLDLIRQHRTTLIFVNNRRLAERTADWLNEQIAAEAAGQASGLIGTASPWAVA